MELLGRCERLRYRAAIIGPHGAGKTTLLEDLETRLQERGFSTRMLRLDTENPAFEPEFLLDLNRRLNPQTVLLLDGAEQMKCWDWLCFRFRTRIARGLIVTSHKAGRLPTLWECRTSAELLNLIAANLLDVDPRCLLARSEALYKKHRGNLRDALRNWYDLCAEASAPAPGHRLQRFRLERTHCDKNASQIGPLPVRSSLAFPVRPTPISCQLLEPRSPVE
jgi:hypothetical protein